MADTRLVLASLWTALMLSYLLGDVLRICFGDVKFGEIGGKKISQNMWLGVAMGMVIPCLMIPLTMILGHAAARWVNIGAAAFFFLFNVVGLPTYKSKYDIFLNVVGLILNIATVWFAWGWR